MKKQNFLSFVLIFTLTIFLCGCGSNKQSMLGDKGATNAGKSEGKVTIQFWNSFTGSDGDVLREIVDKFNKENDKNITIKMDIMPGSNLAEKLPSAIATKTAPALVVMSPADMINYTNSGSLANLNDFFDSTSTKKTDFNDTALELFKCNNNQMLIPMQIQSTFFYWNKDLFKEAGLDPEKPPTTWKEVEKYAKILTNSSKNQYGFGMPVSGAPTWFNAMFLAEGGSAVDMKTKKSSLNSKENLSVLKTIQDLAFNNKVTPQGATGSDTDNLLYSGKLGMYANGPWVINSLKQSGINYGISLMPNNVSVLDGMGFGVLANASDAEKKAAYEFISYWNTTEICKEWSLRNGFPPYLKSVASDKDILADPILSVTVNMVETGKMWLPGLNVASKIDSDILFPMIEAVESGKDCSNELEKASNSIDNLLK